MFIYIKASIFDWIIEEKDKSRNISPVRVTARGRLSHKGSADEKIERVGTYVPINSTWGPSGCEKPAAGYKFRSNSERRLSD